MIKVPSQKTVLKKANVSCCRTCRHIIDEVAALIFDSNITGLSKDKTVVTSIRILLVIKINKLLTTSVCKKLTSNLYCYIKINETIIIQTYADSAVSAVWVALMRMKFKSASVISKCSLVADSPSILYHSVFKMKCLILYFQVHTSAFTMKFNSSQMTCKSES